MTYLENPYGKDWVVSINAFRVSEKPTFPNGAKTAFYFDEKPAYFDTFTPYIKIPKSIGVEVFAKFFHDVQFKVRDNLMMGPCDVNKYNTITLFINDRYNVKLVPESFVIDVGDRDYCFIPF